MATWMQGAARLSTKRKHVKWSALVAVWACRLLQAEVRGVWMLHGTQLRVFRCLLLLAYSFAQRAAQALPAKFAETCELAQSAPAAVLLVYKQ